MILNLIAILIVFAGLWGLRAWVGRQDWYRP